uniref:Titin n=1 Tax=Hippocampus comes TaxID=109280 RepID=A0A3Q2Z4D6_HIPCM
MALDPVDPPGQPVPVFTAKNVITIKWTKPEYDGGFKITGYTVEKRELPAGRWIRANFTNIIETTFTVSGLTQDAVYEFRVMARNSAGAVSGPSEPSDPITCTDSIVEPRIMVDAIFKDVVLLRAGESFKLEADISGQPTPSMVWTKDGKEVENTLKLDVKFNEMATTLSNKDSVRSDGGEFVLTAANVGGISKHIFRVKVLDRPGPPFGPLRVSNVTADNCLLTWAPPLDDGGGKIEGYVVEKRESSRLVWTHVASDLQATEYKVGIGEHADVAGAVVTQDRADEPDLDIDPELRKIVTIKAGLSLRLFIPIKGRPTPSIKWDKDDAPLQEKAQVEVTSSYTALVIDQMNRADSGKYTITAENSSGTKSAFVVVRVLDTPSAPGKLTVKEITSQSVTLAWEVPLLDGGSKIKNYIVEKRESTRKTYAAVVTNCHALSWKIEPLQEGCSYYFRVLAENAYGIGLPAVTVDPLKVSEVPQAPRSLTVTDQTNTSISLAWESPEYDGGSRVIQYLLEVQLKGQEKWSGVNTYKTMEATVCNLNPGEEYLFRVFALNDKGKSDPRVLSGHVIGPLHVAGVAEDRCSLVWRAPLHDGGNPITHYVIERRETGRLAWTVVSSSCTTTCYKVTNLLEGNEYTFRVMAVNNYGASSPLESGAVIMKTPFVVPGPPHIEDVTDITHDGMTVAWTAPESDGDSAITNYVVEKKDRAGIKWTRCNRQKVTDLSFRVTGLTTGHEYEFRVAAENVVGLGEPSLPSSYCKACDPKYKPGCPAYVNVVDSTRSSITVSWGKPLSDGGSAILGYIVEVCKAEQEEWTMVTPPTGLRVNKYEIPKLTESQEYKIQVCALNKLGVGEPAVLDATRRHTGSYEIKIKNSLGSATASIAVEILGILTTLLLFSRLKRFLSSFGSFC